MTSGNSVTVINSAGTVTTTEQLPLWWTSGSRPGVVVGAFLVYSVVTLSLAQSVFLHFRYELWPDAGPASLMPRPKAGEG